MMKRLTEILKSMSLGQGLLALIFSANLLNAADLNIREETSLLSTAKYWLPNEYFPQKFSAANLSPGGVLIAVGSFRAWSNASIGNFDRLVLLDFDSGVVEFNRLNRELILQSEDRYEYWMKLLRAKSDPALLSRVRRGEISFSQFIKELDSSPIETPESKAPLSQRLNQFFLPENRFPGEGRVFDARLTFLKIFVSQKYGPEVFRGSYLTDDRAFERIRQLVVTDRVQIIQGSLSGKTTIRDLARELRSRRLQVAAMDISNALEYMIPNTVEDKDSVKSYQAERHALKENLDHLPWREDGEIMMTSHRHIAGAKDDKIHRDNWIYLRLPARVLQYLLDTNKSRFFSFHELDAYGDWVLEIERALQQNQNRQFNWQSHLPQLWTKSCEAGFRAS